MSLRFKIKNHAERTGIKWEIIEQDYILSWVLAGISQIPDLKKGLIFKGGTALKKCYFGDYRFSQDGDFSVRPGYFEDIELDPLIKQACSQATESVQTIGENVEIISDTYKEKRPHPEGQKAFVIQARLPWHRDFHTRVYLEISLQELVVLPPVERQIIHQYEEPLDHSLFVYPLEEIFGEKIRALLQFAKKLHERGWGRSRVRDYYDLWSILHSYSTHLQLDILPKIVRKKCQHKDVAYHGFQDIFQEKLMANLDKEWETWLADIVPNIPDKKEVITYLKEQLSLIPNL